MKNKSINAFAKQAVLGSAEIKIPIHEWPKLYNALTDALHRARVNNSTIINLIDNRLIGVCPKCHTWSSGNGLSLIGMQGVISSPFIFTGNSGGAERLTKGLCRNYSCSCRDIIIFWKPDEDLNAIKKLAKMGIEIIQRI